MLIELLCCGLALIFLRILFRRFSSSSDDDVVSDVESLDTSDVDAILSAAASLEKSLGVKAYVGLQIPDPDADFASRINCDLVLLNKWKVMVFSVKNMAGFVSVNPDGSWTCTSDQKPKEEHYPNPVAEANWQASVLEAYIKQRGVSLPKGILLYNVITPNPNFRTLNPGRFQPEVIQYDQWVRLITESKRAFSVSGWIKEVWWPVKEQMQESTFQQLQYVLSTAPTWDRLELKGSKYVLGEFREFKGKHEDVQTLKVIKRTKVGQMIVKSTSILGIDLPAPQVLYSFRDYRIGASSSQMKTIYVRSSTEVLFQPQNSKKVHRFRLSTVSSLSLSA